MGVKKAFTLAEIMIVLTVIGVITGILLPIAHSSLPNEKVMKFKKGHATLYKVINELVTSDKYYLDGDLGVMSNGDRVVKRNYFLQSFADVISTKNIVFPPSTDGEYLVSSVIAKDGNYGDSLDNLCKNQERIENRSYVQTSDGIYYYQYNDNLVFGAKFSYVYDQWNPFYFIWDREVKYEHCISLPTEAERDECVYAHSKSGFPNTYSIFCMDIDGFDKDKECDDEKDICPFGYGLNVYGQILISKKTTEWLERDIQDKD